MFEFMPQEVAAALAPAVSEVISVRPGSLLTFGFVGTLWAASSGVEALRIALNRAYRVQKSGPSGDGAFKASSLWHWPPF